MLRNFLMLNGNNFNKSIVFVRHSVLSNCLGGKKKPKQPYVDIDVDLATSAFTFAFSFLLLVNKTLL